MRKGTSYFPGHNCLLTEEEAICWKTHPKYTMYQVYFLSWNTLYFSLKIHFTFPWKVKCPIFILKCWKQYCLLSMVNSRTYFFPRLFSFKVIEMWKKTRKKRSTRKRGGKGKESGVKGLDRQRQWPMGKSGGDRERRQGRRMWSGNILGLVKGTPHSSFELWRLALLSFILCFQRLS